MKERTSSDKAFVDLCNRIVALGEEWSDFEPRVRISIAEDLLREARVAGRHVSDPEQRSILINLALNLGDRIFDAKGVLPIVRLEAPVITGDVIVASDASGNETVTIGGWDARSEELAYLDGLVEKYRYWAEKYTPLAGVAEVRATTADGVRLDLPTLFMPTSFERLDEHGFGEQLRTERVPVDDLRDAVTRYKRLVLLGEPGSGKTTTLWRLAYDYAITARNDPRAPMPLMVPLGAYTETEPVLEYVRVYFENLGPYLPAYLRSGRVILLLDALNEMPQRGYKNRIGRIQAFLDQFPDMPVIVTCRTIDYYVDALQLEKLEVKPLDPERQQAYLRRYLGEMDGDRLFWQLAGGDEIEELWQRWQVAGETFEKFWTANTIPESVYRHTTSRQDEKWRTMRQYGPPSLLALGRNPFMLVMLAQIYAVHEGALPNNRGRIFTAFVDTLLSREEKRHDPVTWPGSDTLRHSLAHLAYAMQKAGESGTAVSMVWAAEQLTQDGVDAGRIIHLCASATLLELMGSQVRFVHSLMQEYFAALALADRMLVSKELQHYWPHDWMLASGWEEIFILLAGILPDMTPLVDKLLPVNPVLATRCISESGGKQPDARVIQRVQEELVLILTTPQASTAQRHAAGDALNHVGDPRPGVGMRNGLPDIIWCDVTAGAFVLGSTKHTDQDSWEHETPQSRKFLEAYIISKYPITNAQYAAFVQDGGYSDNKWRGCWTEEGLQWKGDRTGPEQYGDAFDLANHPVVGVSWYEAMAFCNWLSQKLERPISLPTEEQWERAARHTDGRRYPWGDKITPDHANYVETGIGTTTAVGIFPFGESECGTLDMSGNVWEWCMTKWRDNHTSAPDNDPRSDAWRVIRGGSFGYFAKYLRCASRLRNVPDLRLRNTGFRVVAWFEDKP